MQDSAKAKAFDRGNFGVPVYVDYFGGAQYVFNVFQGPPDSPSEGDTRVYGIEVDEIVVANYELLKRHFELKKTA